MTSDLCPDGDETFAISSVPLIEGIEPFLEARATAYAWAYKRQMAKSDFWHQEADKQLSMQVDKIRTRHNQRNSIVPAGRGRGLGGFSWGVPYDWV